MKGTVIIASILEEFAYGNISPEVQFFKKDSAFGRAMELVSRNEQKLFECLSAEDKVFRKREQRCEAQRRYVARKKQKEQKKEKQAQKKSA